MTPEEDVFKATYALRSELKQREEELRRLLEAGNQLLIDRTSVTVQKWLDTVAQIDLTDKP